jgi:bis(5'-nucleosyl)-tetraphosphatase (symmetrical)
LLGNHDLHLLAVAAGARTARRGDTLDDILDSSRRGAMLSWLRARPLAVQTSGWLCVHAGVSPSWSTQRTLELAGEVQAALRGRDGDAFLHAMYGHEPTRWLDALEGHDRLRHIVNVLTRIRFCKPDGTLEFDAKEGADRAPEGYLPWFDTPSRATADARIAFGHWSTLGLLQRPTLLGLDTGCVWGGKLSAARVDQGHVEITQVDCPACRKPGAGG